MFDLRLWLESLVSPVALVAWCLSLLVVVVFRATRSTFARLSVVVVWGLYLLFTLPITADLAFSSLEDRARGDVHCGLPPPGSVIIVLTGGMIKDATSATDFNALEADSQRRLLAAVALAKRSPNSVLFISGGSDQRYGQADVMGAMAEAMGIAPHRIVLDPNSRTTYESAINTRNEPKGDLNAPRYLLTSAYHLPRAYMAFRDAGQKVCAWPVDFEYTHKPLIDQLTPQLGALNHMTLLLHELLGMAYYRLVKFS